MMLQLSAVSYDSLALSDSFSLPRKGGGNQILSASACFRPKKNFSSILADAAKRKDVVKNSPFRQPGPPFAAMAVADGGLAAQLFEI
jgi:hypothetical protein